MQKKYKTHIKPAPVTGFRKDKKKRVCNSCFYHSSLLLRESTRIEKRELSFPADSPVLEGPVLNLVQSRLGECVTLVWIMCMVDQWWINSTSAPPRSPKIKREISLSPSVSLKVIWVQQTSALHQWTSTLVFVVYARIYHYLQWKVVTWSYCTAGAPLQDCWNHRHLPLFAILPFFQALSVHWDNAFF